MAHLKIAQNYQQRLHKESALLIFSPSMTDYKILISEVWLPLLSTWCIIYNNIQYNILVSKIHKHHNLKWYLKYSSEQENLSQVK